MNIWRAPRKKTDPSAFADAAALTAHQMKMTLANIRLSLTLLEDGTFGPLAEDQKRAVGKLLGQTDSLIAFVGAMLDAAALEHGYAYRFSPCSMEELVNEAAHGLASAMRKKRIVFSLRLPEHSLPEVRADRTMLMQAIVNLLDNAICYTGQGGSIRAAVGQEKGEAVFSLQDSGIGIPRAEQQRIFEKMFRASNARRLNQSGSGLGLFIAKRIALDHGGNVWFESEENKGSVFYLALPIR